jgi:hypothetical protein
LIRASTSFLAETEVVDGRAKPGHDALCIYSPVPAKQKLSNGSRRAKWSRFAATRAQRRWSFCRARLFDALRYCV